MTFKRVVQMKSNASMLAAAGFSLVACLVTSVAAQDAGSAEVAGLPPGTLAIVNGVVIPQARLDDAMRASRQADTPQLRQFLKQELIAREVLRQSAEKQGYESKPEVQQAVSLAKAAAESELYLRDKMRPEPVTDAQVKARYDEIVGMMGDEEYKVRIISVADDQTARTVLEKLRAGTAFDVLVREYSIASSKEAGGEMPWFTFKTPATEGRTQGVPLPIAQAVAHLPVGTVKPEPVVVGDVRVIVRLDGKRATQVPAFDQMKEPIRQQLQIVALGKARAGVIGDLMQQATIQQ